MTIVVMVSAVLLGARQSAVSQPKNEEVVIITMVLDQVELFCVSLGVRSEAEDCNIRVRKERSVG